MSIDALNWAWKQECSSESAKLVLMALADHADAEGECWPAMKRIAVMAGISARQVSSHITSLETAGLLVKVGRRRRDGQLRGWDYRLSVTSGSLLPVASGSTASSPAEATFRSEPSENHQKEPIAAEPRKKSPDLIFEALAKAGGHDLATLTANERGRINKAAKQLRDIDATPEQVEAAAKAYRAKYPTVPCTPLALVSNWTTLQPAKRRKGYQDTAWCPICGEDSEGPNHEELCDAYAQYN